MQKVYFPNNKIKREIFKFLKYNWRTVALFSVPLLFSPLTYSGNKPMQCGYVIIVVGIFWLCEIMNIAVTSLLPIFLFPIFEILDPVDVASCYMKDITLMLIGGLIVAKTIEKQNLHRRLALQILRFMGPNIVFQYLGFMLSTWFISMWISNSSTTAMMITLADAVTEQWVDLLIDKQTPNPEDVELIDTNENQLEQSLTSSFESDDTLNDDLKKIEFISKGLLLSIAYSATCGGLATISGTAPNLVFYGHMKEHYGSRIGLNYGSFMLFSFPLSLLVVMLCWIILITRYIGINELFHRKIDVMADNKIMNTIDKEINDLGSISFGEISTLAVFIGLVLLWMLREPGYPLIGKLFIYNVNGKPFKFWSDGASAILATIFILNLPELNPLKTPLTEPSPKLITWKHIESGLSWGIIFLFGGGFAMALGCEKSGLSNIIRNFLKRLGFLPHIVILFIVSFGISLLTEITSNTVTVTIMLPILVKMAECIDMHPMRMGLTVALSSSFSFCLPAATPPNAIVLSTGKVHVIDMVTSGFLINITCVVVMTFMGYYYSWLIFGTNKFPDWIIRNCSVNK